MSRGYMGLKEDIRASKRMLEANYMLAELTRGLKKSWFDLNSYDEELPEVDSQRITEIIEAKISENPGRPIVILDIGYGWGKFLEDVKRKWGGLVQVIGLGSKDFLKSEDLLIFVFHFENPSHFLK